MCSLPHIHTNCAFTCYHSRSWSFQLRVYCLCCVCHCGGRINSCVGKPNHRNFLLTLLLFLLTSLYGISLVLWSVCPRQNLLTALLYCPGVYNQYRYTTVPGILLKNCTRKQNDNVLVYLGFIETSTTSLPTIRHQVPIGQKLVESTLFQPK